ncbi:MAG TPA: hypothetical protein VKC66_38595 [Xanthobacteraceae bacterium]|nr:hypothetical protein [Xanthobacteraceae bacterium]
MRLQNVPHYRRRPDSVITVTVVKDGELVSDLPGITIPVADLFG